MHVASAVVFAQVWEEVYEHETDKRNHYHAALKDEAWMAGFTSVL